MLLTHNNQMFTYATADSCLIQSHLSWLRAHLSKLFRDFSLLPIKNILPYLDNSGKVWLIRTRREVLTNNNNNCSNSLLLLETIVAGWCVRATARCNCLSRNVSDNKNAFRSAVVFGRLLDLAEQTCEEYFTCKQVIQASTASSHRVGKCIIEPSKQ